MHEKHPGVHENHPGILQAEWSIPTQQSRIGYSLAARRAHIVEGLKAKMLIGVDIMGPKEIDISMAKKAAHVGSCNVDVPIQVHPHARNPVSRVVHVRSTVFIPPYSTAAIPIHHLQIPASRDFLFEPSSNVDMSLYAKYQSFLIRQPLQPSASQYAPPPSGSNLPVNHS